MKNQTGKLEVLVGLPGSGKTTRIENHYPESDWFRVDDFMAHAIDNVGRTAYSRFFLPVVHALRAGRNVLVADICFCREDRRKEFERVMKDAVRGISLTWRFFEPDKEVCLSNAEFDERKKGRKADGRIRAIKEFHPDYIVPPGYEAIPVKRADD